jgi:hypothetical protein
MTCFKRALLLIGLFFLFMPAYSQKADQNYFFQDIGWTITLPLDFALLDLNDYSMNNDLEQETEDADDMMTDVAATQTMIVAIKDRFNYFNITITPFDTDEEKAWMKATQSFKEQVYKNMTKNIGKGQIDSTSSIEFIDGLAFDKFHISMTTSKGVQLDMFLLAKLYKGFDFAITYLSLNDETKKTIELMLKSSRFN